MSALRLLDAPSHALHLAAMDSNIAVVTAAELVPEVKREVPRWFRKWERSLMRRAHGSEAARFEARSGTPFRVSATLWSALGAAMDGAEWSEGTVVPALPLPYGAANDTRPDAAGVMSSAPPSMQPAWRRIRFDAAHRLVTLPPRMRLDLDEVAPAWAADRACARLAGFGPTAIATSEMIAVSAPRPNGNPWQVLLDDPRSPGAPLATLLVNRGGVAVARRRGPKDSSTWPVTDPRTGLPATSDLAMVAVVSGSALEAKVAAASVLVRGALHGLAWIDAQRDLTALVVTNAGVILHSGGMTEYLAA